MPEAFKNMPYENKAMTLSGNGYEMRHGQLFKKFTFVPKNEEQARVLPLLYGLSEKKKDKLLNGKFSKRFMQSQNKAK
jgi:hypothetical protein